MRQRGASDYGDGAVYVRKGSPNLWIRYSANGREQRESAKSTDEKVARKTPQARASPTCRRVSSSPVRAR